MLRPRLIPCLLLQDGGLVKTRGFAEPKYVGDPINAVRIFNEKEADEIIVADISASRLGREPDLALIRSLAAECRMPMCYAGGISTPEMADRIVSLGVEKIAIGSAAATNPDLVAESARRLGSQSVVGVIDARKRRFRGGYRVATHGGTVNSNRDPVEVAKDFERAGAGELLVNSVDQDGQMQGYDLELVQMLYGAVDLQITALGGAGSLDDVRTLIQRFGVIGAAAGSLFVFKGKYRAVLINYPAWPERAALLELGKPLSPRYSSSPAVSG